MNFSLPNSSRSWWVLLHDAAASLLAWYAAYWLRFNLTLPPEYAPSMEHTALWVVPLQSAIFLVFGLYRGIWRFASLPDLQRILKAVAVGAVAIPVVLILFRVPWVVPRAVLLLDPLLLLILLGGSRLAYRAWKDRRFILPLEEEQPVLLLGAGAGADTLLRELARTRTDLRVVAVLDDDPVKQGSQIHGLPIVGGLDHLADVAERTLARTVILAIPSASHALRQRMLEQCGALGLNLLTLPSLGDLVLGRAAITALRRIELEDLLGREPVQLDNAGLHGLLAGRVVLVTGAGGSIGSELCRQIAVFRPARLVLLEASEYALYQMEQEFAARAPDLNTAYLVGDVKDPDRVGEVMRRYQPAVVFHAAAYKHVPLMEQDNALQALKNNVLGTEVVARAARAAGVEKFVLVSTDKAVNPANVMGASKRLAEMLCQALQTEGGPTAFISVRFGNVLGSSGSVIPKFQAQIEAGGPVTVTHPDMTRYFMSIPEAAQLVLQAGLMGRGGEIFILDMGEPVRILDLARLMIRLSGKGDVEVTFSGLRPGEKLREELLDPAEAGLPTPHPKLRAAQARTACPQHMAQVSAWLAASSEADAALVRERLAEWLPEYRPR